MGWATTVLGVSSRASASSSVLEAPADKPSASLALRALVEDRPKDALVLLDGLGEASGRPADVSLMEAAAALATGDADAAYRGFVAALRHQPGASTLGLAAWAARGGHDDLAQALLRDALCWPLSDPTAVEAAGASRLAGRPGGSRVLSDPARGRSVVLVSPADGQEVSGGVPLYAVDLSGQGGLYLSFSVNSRLVWASNRPPFLAWLDTARLGPGPVPMAMTAQQGLVGEEIARAGVTVSVTPGSADLSSEASAKEDLQPALLSASERAALENLLLEDLISARPGAAVAALNPSGDEGSSLRSSDGLLDGRRPDSPPASRAIDRARPELRPARLPQRTLALIFDDGPHPLLTLAILKILKEKGVSASFFLVGIRAEAYPELVRAIAADGHDVENHSYSHHHLTSLTDSQLDQEIAGNSRLLEALTGRRVRFFRSPGGNVDARVERAIRRANLIALEHPYNTWGLMGLPVEGIVRRTAAEATDGQMILLHNGEDKSVFVLPRLIDALRSRGFSFVTVSDWYARRAK